MTEQDKNEIREIIREELNARFTVAIPVQPIGCAHEWITDYTGTIPMTYCRKCHQYQNRIGFSFPASNIVGGLF